jgi:thioesterase domain-containing protein
VKIRGFRIELGEVEAALLRHSAIREAVVIAREDSVGDKRLVAYWIAKETEIEEESENKISAETLRDHLRQSLPEYMLPAAFLRLDALPLTPNGKVDRKALPVPEYQALAAHYEAPQGETEIALAAIWREVLAVNCVGRHDDFFTLGGHSLLAVQLVSRINTQLSCNMPLVSLFAGATVAKMAQQLTLAFATRVVASDTATLIPLQTLQTLQTQGNQRPLFCVPGMAGTAFYLHALARAIDPDRPVYGLQALGLDGVLAPHSFIQDMASYCIKDIRSVQAKGPYLLAGHSLGGGVAFEIAQQLQQAGQTVQAVFLLDALVPNAESNKQLCGGKTWLNILLDWLADITPKTQNTSPVVSEQALALLSADDLLIQLRPLLVAAGLVRSDVSLNQVAGLVQVFRAQVMLDYIAERRAMAVPVFLYRATNQLHRQSRLLPDDYGWSEVAGQAVPVKQVAGDHYSMLKPPNVQTLAEILRRDLALLTALDKSVFAIPAPAKPTRPKKTIKGTRIKRVMTRRNRTKVLPKGRKISD